MIQKQLGRQLIVYLVNKTNQLIVNNAMLTSPEEISEGFNDFFSNIGPNIANEIGKTECQSKTT